jgi:hypothetical protein
VVVAKLIMNITNFNRKKTRYALIAALSIGLSAGSAAFARNLDFKLINDTGYDIHAVYVDPNKSELWTDDVMEHDILPDGSSVFINFTGDADTCIWDLMVEWIEDYDSTVWYNLNLCDISEVTLKYNRNTDETTAFTK